ncbi:MAG: HD domain-containing protein [Clostridia bacterium]|nr:HD domain-containing protein [Clostridia bacterium]
MEQNIINENKQEFLKIARENIKRDGLEDLLKWLESTDFFEAPASSKFHSAEAGGLCFHSLNVYKRLLEMAEREWGEDFNKETVTICALFHDVCKCCFYKTEYRNVKDENGNWVKKPYYAIDDPLPYGHGEKSVYIINGYMRLTREEALAINWHMGGFDKRVAGGDYQFSKAYYKYPICVMTHLADVMATYLDETTND